MGERRVGLGGRAAVAAAAALLGVCAAGGPLYVSSAASQAVQVQLNDGCLADNGMHLYIGADPGARAALDAAAREWPTRRPRPSRRPARPPTTWPAASRR